MVTLNSPATAHTMSIASLGLTGRGRVRRRERVERRSQTVRKRVKGIFAVSYFFQLFILPPKVEIFAR